MPEHVHLLVGEPLVSSMRIALQVLKQNISRKLKRPGDTRFWQRRYYDFNVHSEFKRLEKFRFHAPQSGKARPGDETGRVAVVELRALCDR